MTLAVSGVYRPGPLGQTRRERGEPNGVDTRVIGKFEARHARFDSRLKTSRRRRR